MCAPNRAEGGMGSAKPAPTPLADTGPLAKKGAAPHGSGFPARSRQSAGPFINAPWETTKAATLQHTVSFYTNDSLIYNVPRLSGVHGYCADRAHKTVNAFNAAVRGRRIPATLR